jgi:protein-disulfide isomerase
VILRKRPLSLVLLFCLGCSAQPAQNAPADLDKRIERQVRARYNIPSEVAITVGSRKPSDFPGYDKLEVMFVQGSRKTPNEFLISQDSKTLVRMTKLDLTSDPYEAVLKKLTTAGRPLRGARDSKVTVVVFDDYQCPFCSRMHQTLFREVFKDYQDRMHVIYKDYPLFEIHPWAGRAANDANCLAELNNDAFWDFADAVHLNPQQIVGTGEKKRALPEQMAALDLLAFDLGKRHGLDSGRLQACIKAQSDKTMRDSVKEAEALDVYATPTLFINGRRLEGALDASELRATLNEALRDAGQPAPAAPPVPSVHITPAPQAIPPAMPEGAATNK